MEGNFNGQTENQSPQTDYPEASLSDIQAAEARLAASIEALNGGKKRKKDKHKKPPETSEGGIENPGFDTGKKGIGLKIFLAVLIIAVLVGGGLCIYFFAVPEKKDDVPYNVYSSDENLGYVDCSYFEGSNELVLTAFTKGQAAFLGWAVDNRYGTILTTASSMTVQYDKSVKYYAVFNLSLSDVTIGDITYTLYNEARFASVLDCSATESVIEIPETLNLTNGVYRVFKVDKEAFAHANVVKITLPRTIVAIEESAFAYSTVSKLDTTALDLLESIGSKAFYGCGNLTAFYISEKVTYIGEMAFDWCDSLQITISPDNPKYMLVGNKIVEKT